jgi:hypothetical protein
LQTEVPRFAALYEIGIDAHAIVVDAQGEILPIRELDPEPRRLRVHARVSDRLISNAIHFVADYGVHLMSLTRHMQRGFH